MKKNIVHFGKYYPPEYGGIESVTQLLAEGMASGFNTNVICFTQFNNYMVKEKVKEVSIIRCPNLFTISSQPLSISYFIQCIYEGYKADIIHLHTPNILATIAGLAILSKAKLVVHWHSDIVGKGVLGKLVSPIEKFLLKRANLIIATTEYYARGSLQLKKYHKKTVVLPIGVEDYSNKDYQLTDESIIEFIKNKKLVLSIGRLVSYKGFEYLIQSASLLDDDTVIVIVGQGPEYENLEKLINKLELTDKVMLAGRLSNNNIKAMYQLSLCFCLASIDKAEAYGVVLAEAMSFSLPVIATNIPNSGVNWVNQHGITGLNVPIKNSERLAIAINEVINKPELKIKFSKAARKRYETILNSQSMVDKCLQYYEQIMTK